MRERSKSYEGNRQTKCFRKPTGGDLPFICVRLSHGLCTRGVQLLYYIMPHKDSFAREIILMRSILQSRRDNGIVYVLNRILLFNILYKIYQFLLIWYKVIEFINYRLVKFPQVSFIQLNFMRNATPQSRNNTKATLNSETSTFINLILKHNNSEIRIKTAVSKTNDNGLFWIMAIVSKISFRGLTIPGKVATLQRRYNLRN